MAPTTSKPLAVASTGSALEIVLEDYMSAPPKKSSDLHYLGTAFNNARHLVAEPTCTTLLFAGRCRALGGHRLGFIGFEKFRKGLIYRV